MIVGKDSTLVKVITCFFAGGHLLIEDVPGVGKTMLARSLSRSLELDFSRIQFTPDLLPSDVTGVSVFHPNLQNFEFHRGPVFTNILLADELNRASPRTQSSLLECMEEHQVTSDGHTYPMSEPFFVIATQNPIELDGTYPLPEAQLDRFLMRVSIGYPAPEEEMKILKGQINHHPIEDLTKVLEGDELRKIRQEVRNLHVSDEVHRYIIDLVNATRKTRDLRLGVSPRGGLALLRASQARSYIAGLDFTSPDSVKEVAISVLAHRLILDPHREHAGLTAKEVILKILEEIPVPTLPNESEPKQDPV